MKASALQMCGSCGGILTRGMKLTGRKTGEKKGEVQGGGVSWSWGVLSDNFRMGPRAHMVSS